MRRKDFFRLAIGLFVSGVSLVLAGRNVSWSELTASLQHANPILLLPALGIYGLGIVARSLRWRVLLRDYGVNLRMLFRTLVIGLMVNDILPGRLGEIARIFLLARKAGVPAGASLASILIERVLDGIALTALLTLAIVLAGASDWLVQLALASTGIFAVATAGIMWAALDPIHAGGLARRIAAIAPARLEERLDRLIDTALDALAPVRDPGGAARLIGWSLVAWLLEAGMYLMIMVAFFVPGGVPAALMGTAVANLATLVPSSPGYVGTFDFALKAVLEGWFGASPGTAAGYTLVVHVMLIVPVVLTGLYFLWQENLSLPDLGRRPPRDPAPHPVAAHSER
jgi:glycosyltransferase 2 family protein